MIELKVRKFGNSLGVILPTKVIHRLQASKSDRLQLIETGERDYWLTTCDSTFRKKMAKVERIVRRYQNSLRALAR